MRFAIMFALCIHIFIFLPIHALSSPPKPSKTSQPPCETLLEGQVESPPSLPKDVLHEERLAAHDFLQFFADKRKRLQERDYVFELIEITLLAQEHLLLMGPPGNAKTNTVNLVYPNIVSQGAEGQSVPSYYRIQMTPETTLSETHGPIDFKQIFKTGRQDRVYSEGMLPYRYSFIDEIFDARANALRNTLGVLAERAHSQGPHLIKGDVRSVIAASNQYISEVYEKFGDDRPKAVLDRFSAVAFVPDDFEFVSSELNIINSSKTKTSEPTQIYAQKIDMLSNLVGQVQLPEHVAIFLSVLKSRFKSEAENLEQSSLRQYRDQKRLGQNPSPPYRATKYFSPRTLNKAAAFLKALVVHDWIQSGGTRKLEANLLDLEKLVKFFTLNGPNTRFLDELIQRSVNIHEQVQLSSIKMEREAFERNYREIMDEVNTSTVQYALTDLHSLVRAKPDGQMKQDLTERLVATLIEVRSRAIAVERKSDLSGELIGHGLVEHFAQESLRDIVGEKFEETIARQVQAAEDAVLEKRRLKQEYENKIKMEKERKAEEMRLAEVQKQTQADKQQRELNQLRNKFKDWVEIGSLERILVHDSLENVIDLGGQRLLISSHNSYGHSLNLITVRDTGIAESTLIGKGSNLPTELVEIRDLITSELMANAREDILVKKYALGEGETVIVLGAEKYLVGLILKDDVLEDYWSATVLMNWDHVTFSDRVTEERVATFEYKTAVFGYLNIRTGLYEINRSRRGNLKWSRQEVASFVPIAGTDEQLLVGPSMFEHQAADGSVIRQSATGKNGNGFSETTHDYIDENHKRVELESGNESIEALLAASRRGEAELVAQLQPGGGKMTITMMPSSEMSSPVWLTQPLDLEGDSLVRLVSLSDVFGAWSVKDGYTLFVNGRSLVMISSQKREIIELLNLGDHFKDNDDNLEFRLVGPEILMIRNRVNNEIQFFKNL